MALEFDTEVTIDEDFSKLSWKDRLTLIYYIIRGWEWEFTGQVTGEIEPPDYP